MSSISPLWRHYRTLGHVCSPVKPFFERRGADHFITLAVGGAYHVYNSTKLALRFTSRTAPTPITHLVSRNESVVTAHGDLLRLWYRGIPVTEVAASSEVTHMEILDGRVVVVTSDALFRLYDITGPSNRKPETLTPVLECTLAAAAASRAAVTAVAHPDGYINKYVVGRADGSIEIWNIRRGDLVFTTKVQAPVTALAAGPALDVLAVGAQDGSVTILNLRFNIPLAIFTESAPVTGLSFASAARPLLVSATSSGDLSLWDLSKGAVRWVGRGAHAEGATHATFLPGEDLFVTTGADNRLYIHVCDLADGSARVLAERTGHASAPTALTWYGEPDRHLILSAAPDRAVRLTNHLLAKQNRELSQGAGLAKKTARMQAGRATPDHTALKLAPVLRSSCLAACDLRERQWSSAITAHGDGTVAFWDTAGWVLAGTPAPARAVPTAAAVSRCGYMGFVGTVDGQIDCYSMEDRSRISTFRGAEPAWGHAVFLATDATASMLISVWSGDGACRLHDLPRLGGDMPVHSTVAPAGTCGAAVACVDPASDLVLVVYNDLTVGVIDVIAGTVARRAVATVPGTPVAAVALADGAGSGAVAAAAVLTPSALLTIDILGGRVIDTLEFPATAPATALAASSDGALVVTAHAGTPALALWASRAVYEGEFVAVGADVDAALAPAAPASAVAAELAAAGIPVPSTSTPLLSGLPLARWAPIPHAATIRARMAPTEAPTKVASTPFFLTTTAGADAAAATLAAHAEADVTGLTGLAVANADTLRASIDARTETPADALRAVAEAPVAALLVWLGMAPAAADREIVLLSCGDLEEGAPARRRTREPASVEHLAALIDFCAENGVCIEFAAAWALALLKRRGAEMARCGEGRAALEVVKKAVQKIRDFIDQPLLDLLGSLDFISH